VRALFVWGRTHSSAVSLLPSPRWSCGIIALAGICNLILGLQSDAGKILKRKQVSQFQRLLPANFLPIMGHPNCRRRSARPTFRREAKGKADSQWLDFQRSLV
jgi:hypothetical protein